MKGIFWNGRDVGKKGMYAYVNELIMDHSLDFLSFQETMKKTYADSFFRKIDPGGLFFWKWIPSVGKSRGILCGVRQETLGVVGFKIGEYIRRFDLWDNVKKCKWSLSVVYGLAHDEFKNTFLAEISAICNVVDSPYYWGDFNILRHVGEKNK
uniref:Uncharacterized protein n=1 Tax=Avena sativa TaxID=4498 RepID=A0ACD6A2X5_AVESA